MTIRRIFKIFLAPGHEEIMPLTAGAADPISCAAERLCRCRACYSYRVKRRDIQIKFRPLRSKGGPDEDDLRLSIEERVALVWPLTLDAWAFKGEPVAESRLPLHIVRVLRGRR
jgi:hypothetical protein